MTVPPTVDDLFALIEQSGLLSADRLAPYRSRAADDPAASSESIARTLIRDRLLTPFQARQLLRGRYRGFFLTEKYKILDLLGEGGMGRVLLCEHLMLSRLMAVKLLHLSGVSVPGAEERFLREARAAAAVDHPNIVHVYDVDRAGTTPFMVMEYVDGTNLHQLVAEHGPLAIERAVEYVRQAAIGLHHAHRAGLVHRDIKPGNLLLDRSGTVKVLDLGLARFYIDATRNQNLTQKFDADSILGTADFIAPEQTMNSSRVDIRADIYSLGISFYFMLTRQMPFADGTPAQKILWHQTRDPVPVRELRPEIPPEVASVLEKMIRKDPADRYQTPAEVVVALRPLLTGPVPAPPADEMPKIRPTVFQLGVSPPPGPTVLGAFQPEPATPVPAAETPSSMRSPTAPLRPSEVRPVEAPAPAPPVPPPLPPAPQPAPAAPIMGIPMVSAAQVSRLRRAVLLAVVSVVIGAVAGVAIWAATRSTPGPGVAGTPPGANDDSKPNPPSPQPAPEKQIVLKGGGSTFAAPMIRHWAGVYETKTGVKIEYEEGGSSKGVWRLIDKELVFGCTEAPLDEKQLAEARGIGGEVLHVPLVMGPVVVAYHLPELKVPVKFTGPLLASIYLGKVTRWNDDALTRHNPGVPLPDKPITVVHRAEGSGTTYVWTEFLTKTSPAWRAGPKFGSAIEWPVDGVAARGNDGMAAAVGRTDGAIGYMELTFALDNDLPVGLIQNQELEFIDPRDPEGVSAAANAILPVIPDDLRFSLTDAPGQTTYPIVGTTWAVIYANQPGEPGKELVAFLRWATHEGQAEVTRRKYAPLPPDLVKRIDAKLDRVTIGR